MPILETPFATTTAVTTEPDATPKSVIKTTPVTVATPLTPVSTAPVLTSVVLVNTTPQPTTKAELTIGMYHDMSNESSNFSKQLPFSAK